MDQIRENSMLRDIVENNQDLICTESENANIKAIITETINNNNNKKKNRVGKHLTERARESDRQRWVW